METEKIIKNGKVIAEIFSYFDLVKITKNRDELIKKILEQTKWVYMLGYAGFRYKGLLKYNLNYHIPFKKRIFSYVSVYYIKKIIEKAILKYFKLFKNKINIFVFPTNDLVVLRKMNGVTGLLIWKNTILIYINPIKGIKRGLEDSIGHECAHALSPYYFKDFNLGNMFVFDGIAEHFREYFICGKRANHTTAISRKQAILLFRRLKNKLNSKNYNFYREVFFGGGRYPHWAGYTIGYYIVEEYLKKQKEINWKKIINTRPDVILNFFKQNLE